MIEAVCHQQIVFARKIHEQMDAGTQVLDRSWLELKRFLGNTFPVSLKMEVDPALGDPVSQFVYRQLVTPLLSTDTIAESHVTSKG